MRQIHTAEYKIRHNDALAWSFETARFFVGFYAEPEHEDPADSFDNAEDIEAVRDGSVAWFCASVRVYLKSDDSYDWREIGSDYLGGCAYANVSDFYKEKGGYFGDMVSEAIADARRTLASLGEIAGTMRA